MRPAARMPKLTRRSRILIAVAVAAVLLLLIGPRFIDTYVDWLWFGELGYRSVFTTVLVTRIVVFLVVSLLIGGIVFAALALAYRTRPVFVPTAGPNDPVARYRTAVMTRLRLVGIGVPAFIGLLRRLRRAELLGTACSCSSTAASFGITDPQFGKDLGFYAFDLPFYRLVLMYLFAATFLAFIANLLGHYLFGGIRLSGRAGALSRSARIQLITLVGVLMLLKALAYWLDRYELLSHTRGGKPFTGAGYTDINAVLPAKLILMAIAVICAAAVFSAIVLRDLRIPAIGVVLLLLSSLIVGAGWPLVVEQISVKPNAAQKESEYISRSITATRQAYGLTDNVVTYRDYSGNAQATAQQVAADRATTSNIRLLDPNIVSPAFTQFQQSKNFYYFPDQLSIDRYRDGSGNLRDYVVAARELNPDRLIDNQRNWINRHTVYTHGNGFIASPANTVRGVANDPNQNGGYPGVLGQRGRRQRQRGLARARRHWISRASTSARSSPTRRPITRSSAGAATIANTTTRPIPRRRTTPTPAAAACRSAMASPLRIRRQVRGAELLVHRCDRGQQQDPLQPRPGRAGGGGGTVADHRHHRLPGDREQDGWCGSSTATPRWTTTRTRN